ncbi:hypothetical protein [Xenophilus azovorans]|uniref:hypothetical protein n=1 Tax=Xenophilus azovorans TaxID=151755 RepID=UPI001B808D3C|nr:hypothetical protein [Xenophilus azovorans]
MTDTPPQKRYWRGQIRLPAPLAAWLAERAAARYRTINAEIVDLVLRAQEQANGTNHLSRTNQ